MNCFACGVACDVPSGERVGFRETCEGCSADLHVCRNCAHHDTTAYNECHEPQAERVSDRERANRCDYFRAASADRKASTGGSDDAKAALAALFKKP